VLTGFHAGLDMLKRNTSAPASNRTAGFRIYLVVVYITKLPTAINHLEITDKMQPGIRIYYSKVSYCPTRFERHIAHQQELKNCFFQRLVLHTSVVAGRCHRPATTDYVKPNFEVFTAKKKLYNLLAQFVKLTRDRIRRFFQPVKISETGRPNKLSVTVSEYSIGMAGNVIIN
jgi:hypothetical protein